MGLPSRDDPNDAASIADRPDLERAGTSGLQGSGLFPYIATLVQEQRSYAPVPPFSGRSSGVERNLAKVEVVSSNLIARSKPFNDLVDIPIWPDCSGAPIGHPAGSFVCR